MPSPFSVSTPPQKPLMVFDGDCGFCRKWVKRWERLTGGKVEYASYQKAAPRFPEIPLREFQSSVQLIEPDGKIYRGAEAVFKSLSQVPFLGVLHWKYRFIPGFAFLSERIYDFVASHRHLLSSAGSCGLAQADERPTYFITRGIFLKILAAVYFVAFGSLWIQVHGLIGENGILPVSFFLKEAREQLGPGSHWFFPTLCWLSPTDGFLDFLCGGGIFLSVLLLLDVFPAIVCFLLWIFYLSLVTAGQDFLSFQWDNLLLEAGFLAVFLNPLGYKGLPGYFSKVIAHPPAVWFKGIVSPAFLKKSQGLEPPMDGRVTWLFRWLLFRLMFCSGVVKLSSGDPTWHHLTALQYHYETQPLPTLAAWTVHQMPLGFQKISCFFMFCVELAAPLFIFGPRRLRSVAFLLMVGLQTLILITGNYCFFNYLTLALCLWALEDAAWPRWIRERKGLSIPPCGVPVRSWPAWATAVVLAVVFFMTTLQWSNVFRVGVSWPAPLAAAYEWLSPLRSVNSYGLFMVMTTTRPEIILEGSEDGKAWLPYEFKWKAGNLKRAPATVAPHQPRLDWQMWFAALSSYQQEPWFLSFLVRLLKGSPEVRALLENDPFPASPPKFIRAQLYEYHFTDPGERARTGDWWKREHKGEYVPAFSLADIRRN